MTAPRAEELVVSLVSDARPVQRLAPPLRRAAVAIALVMLSTALAVAVGGNFGELLQLYSGREDMLGWEMAAMLTTGVLAVTGAFFLSIPGRSKLWLLAPLPACALWLSLSALGCYRDFARSGEFGWEMGDSFHCLLFIVAASAMVGPLLAWRLSKARPVDPLPVALLGALGTAAFAAFLLQFFHPFPITFLDLGVHLVAVLLVMSGAALLKRRLLRPA